MEGIKNIIFDLGGVILNIDIKKTELALKVLGANGHSNQLSPSLPSVFREFEAGKMDDVAFVRSVRSFLSAGSTDQQIVDAWNALLLDYPSERIELLKNLKKKYRLFLLSNTNSIHHRQFQEQLYGQTGTYLEDYFEKTYYSHVIGLCKPDLACFQYVIDENELNAAETIFVDDSEANIIGAKEAGLAVIHIKPGTSIIDVNW